MKFLATCACDKVIVDKAGAHSLIAVMSNVDISVTPPLGISSPLPSNAILPREWWIFSMWEPQSDEVGQEFDQVVQVYLPNGDKLVELKVKFKPDERVQYNSCQVLGLPVGQEGKIKIMTWVEKDGTRTTDSFIYHLTVKFVPQDQRAPSIPSSVGIVAIPQ